VSLVRGKLTKLGRMIMSALIEGEVHACDVAAKMLEEGVQNVNDFEWISQLQWMVGLGSVWSDPSWNGFQNVFAIGY